MAKIRGNPPEKTEKEIMQMKKCCSYWLTPNGVRIPKRHIKWMPPLAEKDSSADAPNQLLLPNSSRPDTADQPQPRRKLEVIDFEEVKCNDN